MMLLITRRRYFIRALPYAAAECATLLPCDIAAAATPTALRRVARFFRFHMTLRSLAPPIARVFATLSALFSMSYGAPRLRHCR